MKLDRRSIIPLVGLGAASAYVGSQVNEAPPPAIASPVAVLKAASYEADLLDILYRGVLACGLNVSGKRVLLKPNLVEFDPETPINTDPRFVAAVVELMKKLGAAEIRIGEGPGHRRDTWGVAEEAGFLDLTPDFERLFVDLNRDDVAPRRAFGGSMDLFLSKTAQAADVIISLPKMKTHHWAGVTLSMKNLFGLVPGSVYGWPKNLLHYKGIDESILELNTLFRNTYAIVDGIVAMEGNGPIQGTPVNMGVVVMGRDLVAVDSTCARLMGVDPGVIGHLRSAERLGYFAEASIEQRGESLKGLAKRFALMPEFGHIRLA